MWILFLLLMTGIASADVYVLTDSTMAVKGLSEQNDIVVPSGYKITVIKGNISNLPITGDSSMYNFIGGAFTLNTAKIQSKNKLEQDNILAEQTKENNKSSAITKLKTLGLTDDEIKAITK